jgi:hypothetical protein
MKLTAARRKAIYALAAAVAALLVAYRVIAADAAPLWLALVSALLGVAAPSVALAHVTPDDDHA